MDQKTPNPPVTAPDIAQAIQQKKILDFKEKLKKLTDESGIVMIPVVQVGLLGIYPDMAYLTQEEYQRITQAKAQPSPSK